MFQLRGISTLRQPAEIGYRVSYRTIWGGRRHLVIPILIAAVTVAVEAGFIGWLFSAHHFPTLDRGPVDTAAQLFVVGSIAVMELLRLVQVVSLALASVLAADPRPAGATPRLRVAFVTTIVPSKEPLSMVRHTLQAAKRIRCEQFEVWLLDEGDDPTVKSVCAQLGVRHFSRLGIVDYNTPSGRFGKATKHGNINSWLNAHGGNYDVILCVDPDHVPRPDYAERVLGYFADPDVAYVVGPQFYANSGHFVSRAAESQQFPFHTVVQRAGNRYRSPMLVGTNNAVRVRALMAAGGFTDSITEDMATGIAIQTKRNPATGRRWESVYVPDVIAVGEGPSSWSDYFSQQTRWSRGSFQVIGRTLLPSFRHLSGRARLQYLLIISFYPTMAIGWLLGAANALLFVAAHARGITVPVQVWTVLYADAAASQLWVYFRARRHNVSPYDTSRSGALVGMAMTIMASPLYAAALVNSLSFRRGRFVVTPKGNSASRDSWATFRGNLRWAAFYAALLLLAIVLGKSPLLVLLWPTLALIISVSPIALWRYEQARLNRSARAVDPAGQAELVLASQDSCDLVPEAS